MIHGISTHGNTEISEFGFMPNWDKMPIFELFHKLKWSQNISCQPDQNISSGLERLDFSDYKF